MVNSTADLPDPFVDDPDLRSMVEITEDGHWLWSQDHLDDDGYGYIYREGYHWRAHRWVWFLVHGFTDLPIDHVCRTRRCVNATSPDHLEAVTTAENNRRIPQADTCPAGHNDWSLRADGTRRCLSCHRERERERRKARSTRT